MFFQRIQILFSGLLVLFAFTQPVFAISVNEEEDNLFLAEATLESGDLEHAEFFLSKALAKIKKGEKGFYDYLNGRLSFNRDLYQDAYVQLKQSESSKLVDKENLYRYLALTSYALDKFEEAYNYSLKCAQVCLKDPQIVVVQSRSAWLINKRGLAWNLINVALVKFPWHPAVLAQKFEFLLESNLNHAAEVLIDAWMVNAKRVAENKKYNLAMLATTEKNNAPELAIKMLEFLRMASPHDEDYILLLTKKYFAAERYISAAHILEPLALRNKSYNALLAEVFRRGHQYITAFSYIERINDPKEKLEQLLAIYLDLGNFAMISNLESKLNYHGLTKNDEIKYVLAYAFYENRKFDVSEKYLQKITEPKWYAKSTELRQAIGSCTSGQTVCF